MMASQCHDLSKYLDKCIKDAIENFLSTKNPDYKPGDIVYPVHPQELEVHMWPQMWGNTSCGFGGIAGQAFTASYLVVIEYYGKYRVYNTRFAFQVDNPNKKFLEEFKNKNIRSMNGKLYESSTKNNG